MAADVVLPVHPATGLTALGWTSRGPIWPVLGGDGTDADKDQRDDADDIDTDDDTQDQDTGGGDDWTPPSQQEWERTQTALKKARRDARAAKRDKPADSTGGDAPDVDKAVAEATTAAEGKWKPLVVRAAARTAFVEAGLVLPKKNPDGAMARVLKLLDVDDLEIGDDGQVDGLREQVEEIRADFPELFATARSRTGRVDGADKPGDRNGKPRSSAEAIAALLG